MCPVLALAVVALQASPALAQGGPEQTTRFLKAVEGTVKSIGQTRAQLEKAVATYNSIVDMTAKDMKGAYKDLGKEVEESEKKLNDGRPKVDEMNAEAESYFAAWKTSAEAISDPDLRKRSEQRLADSRARFDKIAAAGRGARESFDTLMKDVKDQHAFLGHDLNPGAIASLKPNAAKFNARAAAVFEKIDGVTRMYDEYMASMKP
jgi:hypothetical protein